MTDPRDVVADSHEAERQAADVVSQADRRLEERRDGVRSGGRRAVDCPSGHAWTPGQLAFHISMSAAFVISEIKARELTAAKFGREYRIPTSEVRRYLQTKGFPLPASLLTAEQRT